MPEIDGKRFPVLETDAKSLLGWSLLRSEANYVDLKLYVTGRIVPPIPGLRVAVVGTRNPSREGIEFAKRLVENLVRRKVSVVSGLARGIDTVAHRTAVESGGFTVAVLGTPIDKFYPPENRDLQLELMRNHMAVSQFPLGSRVEKKNFVVRNWTMALISDVAVIVEAGERSGTAHLLHEAVRLGRKVFVSHLLQSNAPSWLREARETYDVEVLEGPDDIDKILDPDNLLCSPELRRTLRASKVVRLSISSPSLPAKGIWRLARSS